MPQCENISTATYYDKPVTYNDEWEEDDLTYSTFVEKAINSLGVNQHKCQRASVKQPVESCQQFLRFLDDNTTTNITTNKMIAFQHRRFFYLKEEVFYDMTTKIKYWMT